MTIPVHYVEIPPGVEGTRATLEAMADFAAAAPADQETGRELVWLAGSAVRRCASKDYPAELAALMDYVRDHVRYRLDPMGLEMVQTPYWTLCVDGQGDCDDMATLLCALSLCLGHGAALRAVRVDPARPDSYSHVYAMLGCRKGGRARWAPAVGYEIDDRGQPTGPPVWGAADATQKGVGFGWEPPQDRQYGEPMDVVIAMP